VDKININFGNVIINHKRVVNIWAIHAVLTYDVLCTFKVLGLGQVHT